MKELRQITIPGTEKVAFQPSLPRPGFRMGLSVLDRLTALAQTMSDSVVEDEWGKWMTNRNYGSAGLSVPLKGGKAVAFFDKPEFIPYDKDSMAQKMPRLLTSAYLLFQKLNQGVSSSKLFQYALLYEQVKPLWNQHAGYDLHLGYQEVADGWMKLEQLAIDGVWYDVEVPQNSSKYNVLINDYANAPAQLHIGTFRNLLEEAQYWTNDHLWPKVIHTQNPQSKTKRMKKIRG